MKANIIKFDHFGRGIARINDKIIFVDRTLPEEIVDVIVTCEKKNYLEGKPEKIIKESKDRIKPICPFYDKCGGCNFLHTTYETEVKFKLEKGNELLGKIDNFYETKDLNYRNKVTLHYKDGILGLYEEESNKVIDINYCYLVNDKINNLIKELKTIKFSNNCEIVIRCIDNKVLVYIEGNIDNNINIDCDTLIINDKVIKGDGYLYFNLNDYKIRIGSKSFFQVNLEGLNNIYEIINNYLSKTKYTKALDLYSGVSLWSILFNKNIEKIDSIEINKEACDNALYNIKENNINNINVINGKVEDYIDKFKDIDLVITDPPRSGMDNKTIDYIKKINPNSIIYISCNMDTLKRDLDNLKDYNIVELDLVNMFKKTYHCETVCILERK